MGHQRDILREKNQGYEHRVLGNYVLCATVDSVQ